MLNETFWFLYDGLWSKDEREQKNIICMMLQNIEYAFFTIILSDDVNCFTGKCNYRKLELKCRVSFAYFYE